MNSFEKFSKNHTLIFCIILAVVFVILFGFNFISLIIPVSFESIKHSRGWEYILNSINNFIAFFVLLVIVRIIGLSKNIPWNIKGVYKGLLIGLSFIIFAIVQLVLMYNNTINKTVYIKLIGIVISLIYCISIALWEELLCRGIILTSILKKWKDKNKGVFKAVLISSLIFGCAHIITALNGNLTSSLIQVFYATVMGILLGIIYIKTRSLYSVIVIHFILNIPAYLMHSIIPSFGRLHRYEFIGLIIIFSIIWFLSAYLISHKITNEDLGQFIQ